MSATSCPDCGHSIYLETQLWEGQLIRCQNCGVELEVINLDPVELDWVYLEPTDVEEDWDWQEEKVRL